MDNKEMREAMVDRSEFTGDLIGYAIKHLHDVLINSDQEVIDHTCNQLKCSEFELFDVLNCVADEYDVDLYNETE